MSSKNLLCICSKTLIYTSMLPAIMMYPLKWSPLSEVTKTTHLKDRNALVEPFGYSQRYSHLHINAASHPDDDRTSECCAYWCISNKLIHQDFDILRFRNIIMRTTAVLTGPETVNSFQPIEHQLTKLNSEVRGYLDNMIKYRRLI